MDRWQIRSTVVTTQAKSKSASLAPLYIPGLQA